MAANSAYVIGIGTVGAGLWMSYNSGEKWRHIQRGPHAEGNTRALAVSPHGGLWALSDTEGLWRSGDNGGNWDRVGPTMEGELWSIGFDPLDDLRIYVGTRPGVARSSDGGETFQALETSVPEACVIGVPRTTNIVVDPSDSDVIWASVEIGGLHRSEDAGESWTFLGDLGETEFHNDVHGFAVRSTDDGTELLVTSPYGLARSTDRGESWAWHDFGPFAGTKWPHAYSRDVQAPGGTWEDTIVACVGDYIPGQVGALEISRDGGATWDRELLPHTPNSTMYWLASHPEVPGTMVATSLFGQVYVTDDHAETWRKLDREFGEIRAVSLAPAG